MFLLNTVPIVRGGRLDWTAVDRVVQAKVKTRGEGGSSTNQCQITQGGKQIYYTDGLGVSSVRDQGEQHSQYEGSLASSLPLPPNRLVLDRGTAFMNWESARVPALTPEVVHKHAVFSKDGTKIERLGLCGDSLNQHKVHEDGEFAFIHQEDRSLIFPGGREDRCREAKPEEEFLVKEALELKRLYWLVLKQVRAPLEVQEERVQVYPNL